MKLYLHLIDPLEKSVEYYENYNKNNEERYDSGVDVICPNNITIPSKTYGFKIPLGIKCRVEFEDNKPRGYYVLPRSSMGSKTPLRQSNSIGLIDFGYRGEFMLCVDNVSNTDYMVRKGFKLCQIISPDASPVEVEYVPDVRDIEYHKTQRGENGFGSTS